MGDLRTEHDRLNRARVNAYNDWDKVRPEWFAKPLTANMPPPMPPAALAAMSAYIDAEDAYADFMAKNPDAYSF
jgi:hypothetical protein